MQLQYVCPAWFACISIAALPLGDEIIALCFLLNKRPVAGGLDTLFISDGSSVSIL